MKPGPPISTSRPYKTVQQLIELLNDRNLEIRDSERVAHYLNVIGYHRLSAYFRPYYAPPKQEKLFEPGTTFNDIISLYVLDRELRLFLMGPIEKIEIALRGLIINALGSFESTTMDGEVEHISLLDERYYNLNNQKNKIAYKKFANACINQVLRRQSTEEIEKILREIKAEDGLRKSLNPYKNMENVAAVVNSASAWDIVHSLSFGPLYLLFSILNGRLAESISLQFNIPAGPLRTMFNCLSKVRNLCAHHEPIWYYRVEEQIRFPEQYQASLFHDKSNNEEAFRLQGLYIICASVHLLLSYISETTTWYARLKPIIARFDSPARQYMGFPKDWDELRFWRNPMAPQVIDQI